MNLNKYAKNVTSQFGEDGIIEEIFNRIGTTSKICVEFGAWDGVYLSNTWNLWHNLGWNGILIEGDTDKYKDLVCRFGNFGKLTLINTYVGVDADSSLDNVLAKSNISSTIDLLSIDVDGDEYHIFNNLKEFVPRVVIIEHNPTIPPDISIVQGSGEYFGSSALALEELFSRKGYVLVACTETNSIFVISSEFDKLNLNKPKLVDIFPKNNLTYVITSYDGQAFLSQNPVYARAVEPIKTIDIIVKKIKYYFSDYDENILFNNDKLLPVNIYFNNFYYKRVNSFLFVLFNKVDSAISRVPVVGNMWNKFKVAKNEYSIISKWKSSGKPLPPPHIIKQRIIKKYCRDYSIKCLVETGTYLGEMITATINHFEKIYSIEIDQKLYEAAKLKFYNENKVELFYGDSSYLLSELIDRIDCRCIFWLDGHYSEGVTGKGSLETPIVAEIDNILAHDIKNHIILIDDARCFNGVGDYPLLSDFIASLKGKMPNHKVFVEDDVIQVIP